MARTKQLKHGEIWRTNRNRFIWVMGLKNEEQDQKSVGGIWNGYDLESREIRQYYGDGTAAWTTRLGDTYEYLTVVYGHMREPTLIPTAKARNPGTQGVPAIARINRGTVQAFTARTIAKARPSSKPAVKAVKPGLTPIVDLPPGAPLPGVGTSVPIVHGGIVWPGYQTQLVDIHRPLHRNAAQPSPLNLVRGQVVKCRNGNFCRIIEVYPANQWMYHGVDARGDVRTFDKHGCYQNPRFRSDYDIVHVFPEHYMPEPNMEQRPTGLPWSAKPRWLRG